MHSFSVEFEWPTLRLDGEYLYSTSSKRGILPIYSVEKHLVVQERSKRLEIIEIFKVLNFFWGST